MRIGLAQINTTVGDLPENRRRILAAYDALVAEGAELVVFPELVVTGYPPRDLLLKRRFVPDNQESLHTIAARIGPVPAVVGFVEANNSGIGRSFFNSAAFCHNGRATHIARKCLLPTYDVFDEDRYFEPADAPTIVEFQGRRIAVTICEDIWTAPAFAPRRLRSSSDPVAALTAAKIDLHLNLSASPWHNGKGHLREQLITRTAAATRAPLVYCNAVGGNDELIFDGRSLVAGSDGRLLAALPAFHEACQVIDLDGPPSLHPSHRQEEMADIHDALVLGLRDYAHKSGFRRALLGLSGGIDSAVTAVLAAHALGAENVTGVSLPSAISSEHSRTDAQVLAAQLGIAFHTLPIAPVVTAAETTLAPLIGNLPRDTTEENIQARARGLLLMALSNKFGSLLLTTGNKSELAVGYCTLYGDMCGGLAVISDLPKTKVYELAAYINRSQPVIPISSIEKPPSAELRPDQTDQDSLPPYPVLDAILHACVEDGCSSAEIVQRGFDAAVVQDVIRKVDRNEYKRKQAAPGLKLTPLAFGTGRRIPIVQRYVT